MDLSFFSPAMIISAFASSVSEAFSKNSGDRKVSNSLTEKANKQKKTVLCISEVYFFSSFFHDQRINLCLF